MADVVLGTDGGASKTHLALASRDGKLRAFVAGPGTNHEGRGMVPVREIFKDMLTRACRQAGVKPGNVKAGCWGLCGGDLPEDMHEIERHAIKPLGLGGPSLVTNDAFIALFNDRWRDRGVAVTSGSWTKWLGMNGKKMHMHDGIGHVGIRGLTTLELTRVHEGYRAPSAFTGRLLRYLGYKTCADHFNRTIYGGAKRAYIPSVTARQSRNHTRIPEFLVKCCEARDREAVGIFDRYAQELADGTRAVLRTVEMGRRPFDIVLSGSVLASNRVLQRLYIKRVRAFARSARIVPAIARPIRGALNHSAHTAGWTFPARALMEHPLWYGGRG